MLLCARQKGPCGVVFIALILMVDSRSMRIDELWNPIGDLGGGY